MFTPGLVSVIIPTYNMARFLPEAVNSVLQQTYSDLEIHVIDDGSTDNTQEIIKPFLSDPRVFYHHQKNAGVSSARNLGIQAARGEYIGLCDADDLWMPHKLELQVPLFDDRPELGVVYCKPLCVDVSGTPIESWQTHRFSGRITEPLLINNFVTGSTSLIRKACFDQIGLYNTTLRTCEDYDLWLRISVKFEFFYLDEVTYHYRRWEGQVSLDRNEPQFFVDSIRVKQEFLDANPRLAPPQLIREIWAALYSDKALCSARWNSNRLSAIHDIARSLRFRPTRLSTWKSLLKILINRA